MVTSLNPWRRTGHQAIFLGLDSRQLAVCKKCFNPAAIFFPHRKNASDRWG